MSKSKRYSPEFRERAVRMLLDHKSEYDSEWSAMNAIAVKLGCTAETLRQWVRQAEKDSPFVKVVVASIYAATSKSPRSFSGFSQIISGISQFLIPLDQRRGFSALAAS